MKIGYLISIALALLVLPGVDSAVHAETLIMGLIPAENNEEMVQRFEPMRAYLEKKIGQPIKVFTATDYTGVIEAMRKKRVDIAWFGPLSYVWPSKRPVPRRLLWAYENPRASRPIAPASSCRATLRPNP